MCNLAISEKIIYSANQKKSYVISSFGKKMDRVGEFWKLTFKDLQNKVNLGYICDYKLLISFYFLFVITGCLFCFWSWVVSLFIISSFLLFQLLLRCKLQSGMVYTEDRHSCLVISLQVFAMKISPFSWHKMKQHISLPSHCDSTVMLLH